MLRPVGRCAQWRSRLALAETWRWLPGPSPSRCPEPPPRPRPRSRAAELFRRIGLCGHRCAGLPPPIAPPDRGGASPLPPACRPEGSDCTGSRARPIACRRTGGRAQSLQGSPPCLLVWANARPCLLLGAAGQHCASLARGASREPASRTDDGRHNERPPPPLQKTRNIPGAFARPG